MQTKSSMTMQLLKPIYLVSLPDVKVSYACCLLVLNKVSLSLFFLQTSKITEDCHGPWIGLIIHSDVVLPARISTIILLT